MFGIVYGNDNGNNTCVKGMTFSSHQAAYDYMEAINQILDHYAGHRISYHIQSTEKSFDGRYCCTEE